MNTLIVDTSHSLLAVGLVQNGTVIMKKQAVLQKQQSEFLMVFVQEVLNACHLETKDLHKIVVCDGPGSYTGMRIGITFAKTLTLVHPDLKLYTVDTLLSLVGNKEGFVFIDARSNRTFGAYCKQGSVSFERVYLVNEVQNIEGPKFGDLSLLGEANNYGDVIEQINELEASWVLVDESDLLVPRYIK